MIRSITVFFFVQGKNEILKYPGDLLGLAVSHIRSVSVEFHREFRDIKYVDMAKRECENFMRCGKSFIPMKLY
jgi:hypothetical protein